jgi:hypothetical protein
VIFTAKCNYVDFDNRLYLQTDEFYKVISVSFHQQKQTHFLLVVGEGGKLCTSEAFNFSYKTPLEEAMK